MLEKSLLVDFGSVSTQGPISEGITMERNLIAIIHAPKNRSRNQAEFDRRKAVSEQMHIHREEEQNARDGGSEQEFEQSEPNVHAGSEESTAQPLYGQKANEMRFRTCTGYLGYPFEKSGA